MPGSAPGSQGVCGAMRPTLLAVCTLPPWPVRDGYSLRVANLVRELAAGWAITLVCPGDPPPGTARHVPVALHGAGLTYPWRFDPAPLHAALLSAGPHDRGLVWPGAEAAWPGGMHAVMDMIDCNPLELCRTLAAPGDWRTRARALRELPSSVLWAGRAVRDFTATACVGADDSRWMARIGGRPVPVIPNGVDLPSPGGRDIAPTAAFVGSLDYAPNMDAVAFLAGQVWPGIRAAVPGARLLIAGRRPGPAILALHGQDGIEVLPDVPDMAAVVSRAWIGIAPMRTGVGLKNKVLETWAAARPCVMTPLATNGLDLPHGHDRMVASTAGGLAATASALLLDGPACARLGQTARDWVADRYTWAAAAAVLDGLLRQ